MLVPGLTKAVPMCILEVTPTADSLPFLLGDTFLRKVVAVFDAGNKRVGLARRTGRGRKGNASSSRSSRASKSSRKGGPVVTAAVQETESSPSPSTISLNNDISSGKFAAAGLMPAATVTNADIAALTVNLARSKATFEHRSQELVRKLSGKVSKTTDSRSSSSSSEESKGQAAVTGVTALVTAPGVVPGPNAGSRSTTSNNSDAAAAAGTTSTASAAESTVSYSSVCSVFAGLLVFLFLVGIAVPNRYRSLRAAADRNLSERLLANGQDRDALV